MLHLSKICDASDWFESEFQQVIKSELRESPRFHRKQWEFAMIFLALRRLGYLNKDSTGLSMGGGNERVLYSIARYVKKLFVTDLYSDTTGWDCARTDDPNDFIRKSKPFEVDDSKIEAMRMDMRDLQFEDNTFDFCYSSCAIEHIGDYDDFIKHINEVHRCLKEGGVYVLTTEFQFGDETIKDPNNYIFSHSYLNEILRSIELSVFTQPIVTLSENEANFPLPANINNIFDLGSSSSQIDHYPNYSHLLLLRGKHPFTSISLILKKEEKGEKNNKLKFIGYDESKSFLSEGVKKYKSMLDTSELTLSPFSSLPDGVSKYFQDHSEFFSDKLNEQECEETIFHTDYFWLGSNDKLLNISLRFNEHKTVEGTTLQLRVHRYATLSSEKIEGVFEKEFLIDGLTELEDKIILSINEEYNYAVLCNIKTGNCEMEKIAIKLKPIKRESGNTVAPISNVMEI